MSGEEFSAGAALELRVPDSQLRQARQQIESELGAVDVGVSGSAASAQTDGGTELSGRRRRRARQSFRFERQRTDDLETAVELLDDIEEKVGGGEGGGGALGGILGTLTDGAGGIFGGAALGGAAASLTGAATALTGAAAALGGSEVVDLVEDVLPDDQQDNLEDIETELEPVPVEEPDPLPVEEPDPFPLEDPDPIPLEDDNISVEKPDPIPVEDPGPLGVADPSPLGVADPSPLEVETVEPIPVDAPDSIDLVRPTETDSERRGPTGDADRATERRRPYELDDGPDVREVERDDGGLLDNFADGVENFRDERVLPAADEFQDSLRIFAGVENPAPGDGGENIGTPINGPLDFVGRAGERTGVALGELGDSAGTLFGANRGDGQPNNRGRRPAPGSRGPQSVDVTNNITADSQFNIELDVATDRLRNDLDELERAINRRIDDVEQSLRDEIERVERSVRR